jgi:hypothetical protein
MSCEDVTGSGTRPKVDVGIISAMSSDSITRQLVTKRTHLTR